MTRRPADRRELSDLILLDDGAGRRPAHLPGTARAVRTAGRVLDASLADLRDVPGVGPKLAEKIAPGAAGIRCRDAELELCRTRGVELISRGDPRYPPPLLETSPTRRACSTSRGTFEPRDQLAIALVGSRRCTPYGLRIAERLASSTGADRVHDRLGPGAGHRRRRPPRGNQGRRPHHRRAGQRPGQVYPPEHDELADGVVEHGALLSEMPMRQGPLAGLFPQRNRIISGLCLGVVVVEATPRSGSLSTAHHAMEQNREVFAVPGPVDSLASRGCHRLIRDGARLVETVDDILEELGPLVREVHTAPDEPPVRHPAELALSAIRNDRSWASSTTSPSASTS